MKKVIAVICSLVMALGMSTSVFAADNADVVVAQEETENVSMLAAQQGLWYVENYNMPNNVYNAPVTPANGSSLNVWVKNNQEVSMQVYETNWLGTYTQIYSTKFGPGERDVRVKTGCNGKKYLVQFNKRAGSSTTISVLVYQN